MKIEIFKKKCGRLCNFFLKQTENFAWEMLKISPLLIVIGVAVFVFKQMPQLYSALMTLSMLAIILIVVNVARQFLFPHIKLGALIHKASESSIGAAIVFFGTVLFIMMIVFVSMARADTMTDRARPHIPVLQENYQKYWPDAPYKHYMPAQIEQESLWKQFAQLKTSRELGRGFSQMTIAYRADGSVRFNKYVEARQRFAELRGWDWQNDAFNTEYNLLFVVLEDHRNFLTYRNFSDDMSRWAATLVCYNAGCGTVNTRYSICKTTPDCDSSKWFGGLDSVASTGEKSAQIYGRNLAGERNKYPRTVIYVRSPKYEEFFKEDICSMCHPRRII